MCLYMCVYTHLSICIYTYIYIHVHLHPVQGDEECKEDNPRGLVLLCLVDLCLSKKMKHETCIYIYTYIYYTFVNNI